MLRETDQARRETSLTYLRLRFDTHLTAKLNFSWLRMTRAAMLMVVNVWRHFGGNEGENASPQPHIRPRFMKVSKHISAPLLLVSLSSFVGCSAEDFGQVEEENWAAEEALELASLDQAQTAACGPLARGMDESIGCGRRPPVSRSCRTL